MIRKASGDGSLFGGAVFGGLIGVTTFTIANYLLRLKLFCIISILKTRQRGMFWEAFLLLDLLHLKLSA